MRIRNEKICCDFTYCYFGIQPCRLRRSYPGGAEAQKEKLEAEGHTVLQKGRTNIKYVVKDYEKVLYKFT